MNSVPEIQKEKKATALGRNTKDGVWHAVYCRPHHEKRLYKQLTEAGIEAYLPMQTTLRQWSDRRKKVTMPLFSCYVFVKIMLHEYYQVLNHSSVISYVSFEGKAAVIPEKQIETLRNLIENDLGIEDVSEPLPRGIRVEITSGPLKGIKGEVTEYAGRKTVIIRLEEINKTMVVQIAPQLLKRIDQELMRI